MKKIILALVAVVGLSLLLASCENRKTCKRDCSNDAEALYILCAINPFCYIIGDAYESSCKDHCNSKYDY